MGTQSMEGLSCPICKWRKPGRRWPYLAAAFYGHPGRQMTVIGVTGTDGKTTTSNIIYKS